ncbi:MAG: futalosine hydrolase [Bacteroidia bacterium]|nr:futalosine hydrolase [Bacteroidia bacterium]MDW8348285.1 futalosine hydrolase [Bacteroidia bacterium]
MRILLVCATPTEIQFVAEKIDKIQKLTPFLWRTKYGTHLITILITGIGMVNTALRLSPLLSRSRYDIAIQIGIAGSYVKEYAIGTVVEVIQENYADLGAENNDGTFLNLKHLGFPSLIDEYQSLYFNTFHNLLPSSFDIPKVKSNTVNLCSGTSETIRKRLTYFNAHIENMEGAAFFQTCILYEQPFYSFRAISNYVIPRDTSQWDISLATRNLSQKIINLFTVLS